MDYLKKSRIEEVLIAILGKGTVTSQLISRIEKILDAIRVNGSYDGIAMSEVEEILICILRGERFEKPTHSRIAAMLKVKANGGEYTELRKSRVEELIFEWINAVESATYTGTLPTTLRTVEGYLESYKIYGNPSGCGVKVDITGLNEPLCGIGTYTDTLNLSTGMLTRRIKKLVLTGNEDWRTSSVFIGSCFAYLSGVAPDAKPFSTIVCTHVKNQSGRYYYGYGRIDENSLSLWLLDSKITAADFKSYLADQYANGTPVTVWYVLAEPEVSTIPVPSGLTGTIEGYLIQDGTPSPETPIYPTANGVKQADDTYSIPYGYKLPLMVNGAEYPIYIGNEQLAKDEYVDSATGKIYRRTKNLSPPEEEWADEWIWGDGTVHPSTEIKTSPFIDVSTCETCIMEVFSAETEWAAAGYREMAFYDENKQFLGWIGGGGRRALTPNSSERLSEFPTGTVYVRISCSHSDQPFYPQLVSGYTPTHRFYPYLVPTDPPVPFPQIPTFAGTTVIDYNGTSKPDKVEFTYSKPK